jgi:SNF2 family DNA or RNA helicase
MIQNLEAPPAALHGELTADGKTIVLIGTGTDVAVAQMAARIQLMTPLIKPSDPPGALLLPATWAAVVQLSHLFGPMWRPGPRLTEWLMAETLLRAPAGGELAFGLPDGLTPRPYQVDGALMIGALGRALLFDDPGTGKTITTLLGLMQREAAGHVVTPVVVIAPASVVDPWVEAVRTWAPHWRVSTWRGSPQHRRRLADRPEGTQAHVVVASYDTARVDAAKGLPLDRLAAKSVVVDECHLIKSSHAARSVAARRLAKRAANFVALSGTPITHHPGDLWPTLEALAPLAWPSGERWKARYCTTIPGDYSAKVIGLNEFTESEMRMTLLGQHRRVAKADVLSQLPPKVYSVRQVELPPAYRKAYDQMEDDMLAELPGGEELSVMSVLAQLTRLQQLASAAAEMTVTSTVDEDGFENQSVSVRLKAPSWKVDALLEVLAERPGEPVVAFAPSRQLVLLAGEMATAKGLQVGYVVGGQSMKDRTDTVDAFQRGKLDLLCVTTGAGGVGLTLTAAKTVVFLQRPWSLVEAAQAEDRCHRIGSEIHDAIEIVDIVATKTIDTRIRAVLHEKAGQLADLLNDRRIVTELLGGSTLRKAG